MFHCSPMHLRFSLVLLCMPKVLTLRHILVTGGNKGIGLALCKQILLQQNDTFVHLGSRDQSRGDCAVASILAEVPGAANRLSSINIDVSSDDSVNAAAAGLEEPLYAIVNNAGIGFGRTIKETTNTNFLGAVRVNKVFTSKPKKPPMRIVNVASGSASNFVASLQPQSRHLFTSRFTTTADLTKHLNKIVNQQDYDNTAYGFSKALLNTYTAAHQRACPDILINSVSPGWILTDMTTGMGASNPPEVGARPILKLLFEDAEKLGRGWYFGSDGERSPLDEYREPNSPPYTPPEVGWGLPGWNWGSPVGDAHDLAMEVRNMFSTEEKRNAYEFDGDILKYTLALGLTIQAIRRPSGPGDEITKMLVAGDFSNSDADGLLLQLRNILKQPSLSLEGVLDEFNFVGGGC